MEQYCQAMYRFEIYNEIKQAAYSYLWATVNVSMKQAHGTYT